MAVYLRAIFAPGIRVVGCIPCLGRGHGRQGTQRLIVLSYVLAGTDSPSADRLVTVLEPKALIRAPTMRSAKLDRSTCNALNLKAQPSPPAVPTRRSSESNRTAQHIVHASSRPQTASPAESNRVAFPFRATGSPLFPACPALRPSSSPSARHSAQSAHCPRISADYQRTIDPLRTNIRKFRLFSRPPTATSATSPRTARLSHLSKHFPRSQHPLPFPIFRQFPIFA